MIVFEERIEQLIGQVPLIETFKTHFYWGNGSKDVNLYLTLSDQPYPFVFLTTGQETSKGNFKETRRNCKFIIACQEEITDKINTQRMLDSYRNVLNPLADYMIEIFDTSSISRLNNGYKLQRIPNYSDKTGENYAIAKWDVILLEVDLSINDNCLNNIQWQ
jgi:hypothetical protein